MRKAIIPVILVTALAGAALFSGCATTGSGKVVTEEKDFTDFTRVEVEGTFDVDITQSNSFSITISVDDSFYDYVAAAKEGKTLRIYLNPRHTFTDFTLQVRTLKAKITMPALYGLRLSGASKGTVTGFKSSADFSLDISGESSLKIINVAVGDVNSEISGASKISGNMTADDVNLEVSGASKVELEGSANDIILNASGASKVDLADFPLNKANVNLSGASEASLHVKGRLDSILIAASRLYFQGNPTMGNVKVSGASKIKHK